MLYLILATITPVLALLNWNIDIAGWALLILVLGKALSNRYFERAAYCSFGLLALAICKAFPFCFMLIVNYPAAAFVFGVLSAALILPLYYNLYCGLRQRRREKDAGAAAQTEGAAQEG